MPIAAKVERNCAKVKLSSGTGGPGGNFTGTRTGAAGGKGRAALEPALAAHGSEGRGSAAPPTELPTPDGAGQVLTVPRFGG